MKKITISGNIPKYLLGRSLLPIHITLPDVLEFFGLKDKPENSNTIIISKSDLSLKYIDRAGNVVFTSKVSTGKNPGNKVKEGDSRTPEGEFTINSCTNKADKNIFGDTLFYGLSYGNGIGIHGDAHQPNRIGSPASHGCIRMPNNKLRDLQKIIGRGIGTKVKILP